jgi:hypothetical protein
MMRGAFPGAALLFSASYTDAARLLNRSFPVRISNTFQNNRAVRDVFRTRNSAING